MTTSIPVAESVQSRPDYEYTGARSMPTWLTVNEAAERDDCPVTGETLRQMIKRGDVPATCYEERPFGRTRIVYYIDADCLAGLDYREPGQRGRGKN